MIYPRKYDHDPFEIKFYLPIVDALSYPLINAYGELSWNPEIPYCTEKMNYIDRMVAIKAELLREGIEIDWDINASMETTPAGIAVQMAEINQLLATTSSQELDDDVDASDSESVTQEGDRDEDETNELANYPLDNPTIEESEIRFTEQGGDLYPHRESVVISAEKNRLLVDDLEDSGDEMNFNDEQIPQSVLNQYLSDSEEERSNLPETPHQIDDFSSQNVEIEEMETDEISQSSAPVTPEIPQNHRKHVSLREWFLFNAQKRLGWKNRISASRKLGQLYTNDYFIRILRQRGQHIEKNFTQTTITNKKNFLDYMNNFAVRHNRRIGALTYVPQHVKGSPRYLREQFEKAVTLSNNRGHPDLFITFTASSQWKEFKENIPKGESWADHPFLVAEVFKKKLDTFLKDVCGTRKRENKETKLKREKEGKHKVLKGGLFGDVNWYVYSIEYQQRGLPHAHIVISLADECKPRTPEDIDRICQAELPVVPSDQSDPNYERLSELRDLVEKLMMHSPCEQDPNAYCRAHCKRHWKTCGKRFPKPFNNSSRLIDDDYAILKRPNNGECSSQNPLATNQYVVAHNQHLLLKFQAHINVEIISNLHVLKYLYKYLFKGFNRALLETIERTAVDNGGPHGGIGAMTFTNNILYPKGVKLPKGVLKERDKEAKKLLQDTLGSTVDANNQNVLVYNEVQMVEDMRAVTSCEAAWEISDYETNGCSHTVATSYIHEPDGETVKIERGNEEEILQHLREDHEFIPSMLKGWFEINSSPPSQRAADLLKELTFCEMPKYFSYKNKKWVLKKLDNSDNVVCRLKSVHPKYADRYAIRLLAMNRKFIKSFLDLRTVHGTVYSFVDAAKKLGLITNELEYVDVMNDAVQMDYPINIRRLFASILIFCAPVNPRELWDNYKSEMFDRKGSSDEQKEARALYHIRSILRHHNLELRDFHLPEIDTNVLGSVHELDDDDSDPFISPTEIRKQANQYQNQLNTEQKAVFDGIMRARDDIDGQRLFFVEGSGGCGKTFLYSALYYALRSQGFNVISVAHTGVATRELPNGSTVHKAFGIPLNATENMQSQVNLESDKADFLKNVDVILWDEATMSDRRVYNCVNRLLQALHEEREDELFGGVMIIAGGDWKQTLPIVPETYAEGVLDYTLKKSVMWPHFQRFQLLTNMRAITDPAFAQLLLNIGNGSTQDPVDRVELPESILRNSTKEVVDFVFPDNVDWTNRSVLTVTNETSLALSEEVLNKLPGESKYFTSVDKAYQEKSFISIEPETYHSLTPSGLPPHVLRLKINCEVMLLRNLNVRLGLCNGTRLRIIEMTDNLLLCEPVRRTDRMPERVFLHRMPMTTADRPDKELMFIRHQFPVRLSYSLTINKAQGQSLEKVGVVLPTPCFAHGQLYVALSRAHRQADIALYHYNVRSATDRHFVQNIVYKEILL